MLPPIVNAFDDVVFCNPIWGINGAVPAEVLHIIQHGLCLYLRKGLFGTKKTKVTKKKKPPTPEVEVIKSESESSDGEDSDSDSDNPFAAPPDKFGIPDGLEVTNRGVFPPAERIHFNFVGERPLAGES